MPDDLWERLRAEVAGGEQRLIGAVQHAQAEPDDEKVGTAAIRAALDAWAASDLIGDLLPIEYRAMVIGELVPVIVARLRVREDA